MLRRMNKAAVAGLMAAVATCAYFLGAPPVARAERAWCGNEQAGSCNDYCYDRGYGYYCCLVSGGGGYQCTCYSAPGNCD
jgi:hypothetical protein